MSQSLMISNSIFSETDKETAIALASPDPLYEKKTIEIRKTGGLKLPDSIIVAAAIVSDAILVTSDKKLLNLKQINTIDIQELVNI